MLKYRLAFLAICLVGGSTPLWGQASTGGNAGGSGGTSGNQNRGGGTSQGQTQNQGSFGNQNSRNDPFGNTQQDPFGNQMRPLYLHGRVIMDDGQPPPEPVVVQRVCQGNAHPEGYTDTKGRFSFQVCGDLSLLVTDASVSGAGVGQQALMRGGGGGCGPGSGVRQVGLGRFDLSSCTLRAQFGGYVSDEIQLGMYSSMGNNDVGIIRLLRIEGVVGHSVSALTLAAPKPAQKAYQSGIREMRKKRPNFKKGVAQLEKAVAAYPEFAAAWAALGEAKLAMEDKAGARTAFSKSVEADPKYLRPYEPLIQMAVADGDWQALETLGSSYLELNPNAGRIRFLTAVAALNQGDDGKAEEMVQAMQARDDGSRFPQSYEIMARIHERRADFEKAAEQYRTYLEVAPEPESRSVQQAKRKLHEWQVLGVIQANPN